MYAFERRFTAKYLTMFGLFLTHSQSVRAKNKSQVQADREVVTTAVKHTPAALEFASRRLQADKEVVRGR